MTFRKLALGASAALVSTAAAVAVPATASAAPAQVPGTPCTATAKACVNLSTNHTWLIKNGKAYGPAPITAGRPGHETPPGTFQVQWKDIDHRSSQYGGAPMPYSVFFNSGIAFHAGSLAEESHGCIHLPDRTAKHFYRYLNVGDEVQVRS